MTTLSFPRHSKRSDNFMFQMKSQTDKVNTDSADRPLGHPKMKPGNIRHYKNGWDLSRSLNIRLLFLACWLFSSCRPNVGKYVKMAREGQQRHSISPKRPVVIIDYTKPLFIKRLHVIQTTNEKILLSARVSHAWNSGMLCASRFSNEIGSLKSSRGHFRTGKTNYGRYGYSLTVDGLDMDLNNNARRRAILFHSTKKMKTRWSAGCFATEESVNRRLIDMIKNGCLVIVIR